MATRLAVQAKMRIESTEEITGKKRKISISQLESHKMRDLQCRRWENKRPPTLLHQVKIIISKDAHS